MSVGYNFMNTYINKKMICKVLEISGIVAPIWYTIICTTVNYYKIYRHSVKQFLDVRYLTLVSYKLKIDKIKNILLKKVWRLS